MCDPEPTIKLSLSLAQARARLKQWPGKDGVQALAAWWIASTLVDEDGHE